jgi:hypothetical protein
MRPHLFIAGRSQDAPAPTLGVSRPGQLMIGALIGADCGEPVAACVWCREVSLVLSVTSQSRSERFPAAAQARGAAGGPLVGHVGVVLELPGRVEDVTRGTVSPGASCA